MLLDDPSRLLQADECVFSVTSVQRKAWSAVNVHFNIGQRLKYDGCIVVITAVSERAGLVYWQAWPKSIDQERF
jgi:hypothetical protein